MKPWMARCHLDDARPQGRRVQRRARIDKYFFDKAKAAGMERRALETVAYQFDRLDQMPSRAVQEAMLRSVIADIDTQLSSVKTIAEAWSHGDTATLEKLLLGSMRETPELYDRLLTQRNRNWVAPVEACCHREEVVFCRRRRRPSGWAGQPRRAPPGEGTQGRPAVAMLASNRRDRAFAIGGVCPASGQIAGWLSRQVIRIQMVQPVRTGPNTETLNAETLTHGTFPNRLSVLP